jgi:hypothetical protein
MSDDRDTPRIPPPRPKRRDPRAELDTPAMRAAGLEIPRAPRVPKFDEQPPKSDHALQLKIRDPKGWGEFIKAWATIITAISGLVGVIIGGGKIKEAFDKLDVQAQRISALIAETEAQSAKHAAAIARAEARIQELNCQVGVLASIAQRQGFESGFATDIEWLSARLEQPNKPKAAPLWITRTTCVRLP